MWVFVLGDMVIFAMYFIVYMVRARRRPAAVIWQAQQDLNQHTSGCSTPVV